MKIHRMTIETKAIARYFKDSKTFGYVPDQPSAGGCEVNERRKMVTLSNRCRTLARYRYKIDKAGRLRLTEVKDE